MCSLSGAAGVHSCPIQSSFPALLERVKKLSCVFMGEYVCGKSGWLRLGRLNSWAEHGTTSVGKSDEKDTEVGVKLLPADTLLNMFSLGKLPFRRLSSSFLLSDPIPCFVVPS